MKVVIVDDEAAIREGLIQLLTSFCPDINSIREASGVHEALKLIEELQPKKTYLTHVSHHLGFHAEVEKTLPEHVFLAYDELVLEKD